MKRDIKFRVWDKVTEKFVKSAVGGFGWPDYCEIRLTLEGNLKIEAEYGEATLDPDRYIIQQYIGIEDDTGKEIYEGDIVELETGNSAQSWIEKILPSYNDLMTIFKIYSQRNPHQHQMIQSIKVVGNIFEKRGTLK
jgi:uncharacterized phage protein (TIGR01671 family)